MQPAPPMDSPAMKLSSRLSDRGNIARIFSGSSWEM